MERARWACRAEVWGSYLVLSFLDDDKYMHPLVFNIATKELVNTGDQHMLTPSRPVSTMEPMAAYNADMLKRVVHVGRVRQQL